jgi:endonuclease YncB( thermonuclease family)
MKTSCRSSRLSFMKSLVLALGACGLMAASSTAGAAEKAEDKWIVQKGAEFLEERQADGDSFGMTVIPAKNRVKRTYRLYGVDCPETDARGGLLVDRIADQAKHFGVKPEEIPAMGKKAADYTVDLLKNGNPLVRTLGLMGEDAPGGANDPKRRYALVEVTAPDGSRRMLHELLIETGLARAHGQAAPWPEKDARHRGEKKAKELFMKDLERMEKKAKDGSRGFWGKP